ncbi:hypothetical protein WR25_23381 [Diploscapter pachys]|uniref:Uncharacterized protein n=1 Tax=Diploscapter pachys TaxID=2018661 RepID=A0A2A2KRV3_9BILA|nr:hypothetical protein WR25_23381 [Diploscapter pachys]
MVEEEIDDNRLCRAILWTQKGPRRLCVPVPYGGKPLTAKAILQRFPEMVEYNRQLKEVISPKIQKELIVLEDQEGSVNCKFGVIFAHGDQVTDAQMLSNEHGNEHFERFLRILGQRIELQHWGSYRGGLDTTTNSTGKESVYTVFAGHEIMFHVSTLLPYSKENEQQIERKRHVGNDIVNIVFESSNDPLHPSFSPTMMKSHFTHVFALITYEESTGLWRLWMYSEESVPAFGPSIPHPNTFSDPVQFREFLLTKLINAEKAAFNARVFVEKRYRTNDTLLKDMYMEYMQDTHKGLNKVTDTVIRHLRSPIRKEAPRETADFCKLGELIKLEKMLSGDVADSPWDKELVLRNIPSFDIVASDSWGASSLLVVTEDQGVVFVSEEKTFTIIEKEAKIQQIAVLEHFGLMIARMEKGKDACLLVFALAELRSVLQNGTVVQRKQCQQHRIPGTKGCHFFSPSDESGLRLNIVACVGKKLLLLRWAFGPLGRISLGADLTNNFTMLTSHSLPEEPTTICVYEKGSYQSVVKVIVLAKSNLYIVNLTEGTEEIVQFDVPKFDKHILRSASDGESDEFVLLHQNNTLLFDEQEGKWRHEKTFWSTSLNDFAFRFPFIIGFGEDLIEIRLAVNGNLLASMYMPSVKLLSSKRDVVFSVERPFSSTFVDRPSRSSMVKKQNHESKRWDVYRFKAGEWNNVATRERENRIGHTPHKQHYLAVPIEAVNRAVPEAFGGHPGQRLHHHHQLTIEHNYIDHGSGFVWVKVWGLITVLIVLCSMLVFVYAVFLYRNKHSRSSEQNQGFDQAVYKWVRRQSSDSDTPIPYVCAVIGSSLWLRYSIFLRDIKLILLQSYAVVMQTFFISALLFYRKKKYKAISSRCIDFVPLAPVAFTLVMEVHAIIYSIGIDDFYMLFANSIFFCMDGSLLMMFCIFPSEKPNKPKVIEA